MTVTIIGAGHMGTAMALRLSETNHDVTVWNRSPGPLEPLRDAGLAVSEDLTDAVAGASVVITMLTDGEAVGSVAERMLSALDAEAVWLQASTVGAEWADRLRALAQAHDRPMLDAPVAGSTTPARNGSLTWLVSGSPDAVDRARPVLDALGARTVYVGEAQQASRLKLVINAWMTTATVALADALQASDALGVGQQAFLDVLTDGPLAMPYALQKAALMRDEDYQPGFPLELALKDVRLLAQEQPTPLLDVAVQRLSAAVDAGHGRDDLAAVAAVTPVP
jgi:3-hydroxyisobutyrate dehydrogenase